jgi:7,8-dihydro-6-hydroxymethylpterin-pyrophosphokinase
VIEIKTSLNPGELLEVLLVIEDLMGRKRGIRWGPRNIDLDLLLYNDLIIQEKNLTIPHPRLHERRFVLQPLSDIYPDFFHPEMKKSIGELIGILGQEQKIDRIEEEIRDF